MITITSNRLKWHILSVLFLLNITSPNAFAQRLKHTEAYFSKPSNVGLMVTSEMKFKLGRSGTTLHVINDLLTDVKKQDEHKYDSAFKVINPSVDPFQKAVDFYTGIYSAKGKTVSSIDEDLHNAKPLDSFFVREKQKDYYKQDLRYLHEKYGIDEVLLVNITYGVRSEFSYDVVEQNRRVYVQVSISLVDLRDNSFIINDNRSVWKNIKGKWNKPPEYQNLKRSIQEAIEAFFSKEKMDYELIR